MFKWKLQMCRPCHYFMNSSSVSSGEREQYISVQEAVVLGAICSRVSVSELLFQREPWGDSHLQPDAVPPLLERGAFGKWRLWVSFHPLKTCQMRKKTKLSELNVSHVCRNLFFHQTTKPLALASSAVSHDSMCVHRRFPPVRNGWALRSSGVWGQQCSSWLPIFLCTCQGLLCFSPPVMLQHCLLSCWCSWAKLECEIQS